MLGWFKKPVEDETEWTVKAVRLPGEDRMHRATVYNSKGKSVESKYIFSDDADDTKAQALAFLVSQKELAYDKRNEDERTAVFTERDL